MKVQFSGKPAEKIKAIKVLREAYVHVKLGLRDAKDIVDKLYAGERVIDNELQMPPIIHIRELKEVGIRVEAVSGGLELRLKQLTQAAIRDGETELALDLLGTHCKHFPQKR